MRVVLIIIVLSSSLSAQNDLGNLIKESGYFVRNLDTLLSYEIEYDSLSRKSQVTNYPLSDKRGVIRLQDFYYRGDTIIELHRTVFSDTLKRVISIDRNDQKIKIEDRTYGWWTSGAYSKGVSNVVYKYIYNEADELMESIFYTENKDTTYQNFYEYNTDTLCSGNITIQYVHDSTGQQTGKRIMQKGMDCLEEISCDSNCTKTIITHSPWNENHPISSTQRVFIQNGDTIGINRFTKTKLSEDYHTQHDENIFYDGSFSHYHINYYHKDILYLKESFGWKKNKWVLTSTEAINWSKDKLQKNKIRTSFRNGKKDKEYHSFVVYEYEETPMNNKR